MKKNALIYLTTAIFTLSANAPIVPVYAANTTTVVGGTTTTGTQTIGGFSFTAEDGFATITACSLSGNITIPSQLGSNIVTKIGNYAFRKSSVTSLTLPDTLTAIGRASFQDAVSLTSVNLPENVTEIGAKAFSGCESLISVMLPDSLESIGSGAFSDCSSALTIYANSNTYAEEYAADNGFSFIATGKSDTIIKRGSCGDGTSYTLDKNGTLTISGSGEISDPAWQSFKDSVITVIIEDGISKICENAFYDFDSLVVVTVNSYLDSIGENAFSDCENLRTVIFNGGVETIYNHAFSNCPYLFEITLPETLISLYPGAFSGCERLYGVSFGNNTKIIGDNAFYNCYNLTTVNLPEKLEAIGERAFYNCSCLSELFLGKYLLYIAPDAIDPNEGFVISGYNSTLADSFSKRYAYTFKGTDCEDIILLKGTEPGGLGEWSLSCKGVLSISGSGRLLYDDWRNIQPSEISNYCFTYITSVNIGEGITQLNPYAFYGCEYLSDVTIPQTLITLDDQALASCSESLTVHAYENSPIKKYSERLGYNFESLGVLSEAVIISDEDGYCTLTNTGKLTVNAENVHSYNASTPVPYKNGVLEIVFENAINIENGCFSDYTLLEKVTFPETILTIGENNFTSAPSLIVAGYSGTAAESFANAHGYSFESLGTIENAVIASGSCGENAQWTLESNGTLTISGNGDIEESPDEWYTYRSNITKLVIDEGIERITENSAFSSLSELTGVLLPESLYSIGDNAFYSTNKLKEITIGYKVTYIGYRAFGYNDELVINGLTGSYAEYFANENNHIFNSTGTIPDGILASGDEGNFTWSVTTKGVMTFSGYGEINSSGWDHLQGIIKEVVINEGIEELSWNAFDGAKRLEKVTLPDTLTNIWHYAFDGTRLKEINLGDNLAIIGEGAFRNTALTEITLPKGIDTISSSLFSHCESLASVTIPDNIHVIEEGAFYGCSALKEIEIPYNVMLIGNNNFTSDTLIKGYTGSAAEKYAEDNGLSFESIGDATNLSAAGGSCGDELLWSVKCDGSLSITGSRDMEEYYYRSYIPWSVISECITSVSIEEGITSLCDYAFENTKITQITIPESIKIIPDYAFYNCKSLKSVTIPYTVTRISQSAFTNCTDVTIVGYTGSTAEQFASDNGFGFESLGEMPEGNIAEGTYGNITWAINNSGTLSVKGSGEISDNVPWSDYTTDIKSAVFDDAITKIGDRALSNCNNLKSVKLPSALTEIEEYAFYNCYALTEIEIPSGVTKIGYQAFGWCSSISEVTLPDGVTQIDYGAFDGCYELSKINIPESVTTIGGCAFQSTRISEITIPYTVTSISDSIFNYCEHEITVKGYDNSAAHRYAQKAGHTYVSLGETPLFTIANGELGSVKWSLDSYGTFTLSGSGYADFSNLAEIPWESQKNAILTVTIKEGVTGIDSNAFSGCESLSSVTMPESLTKLGSYSFAYCPALTEVTIPKNIKEAEYAFYNCASLLEVTFTDGCTMVDKSMFNYCSKLKKVTLPDTISAISDYAFNYCNSLQEISIPSAVTLIGSSAFGWCYELSEVTLSAGLKKIDRNAFAYTNINEITIPYTVSIIDDDVFYGVNNLTINGYDGTAAQDYAENHSYTFVSLGEAPVKTVASGAVNSNIDWELDSEGTLTLMGKYSMPWFSDGSQPWYEYKDSIKKVVVLSPITSVSDYAFKDCVNLKTVSLPESVGSIDAYAFYGCNSLCDMKLPSMLYETGNYAFSNSGIKELTIPGSMTCINSYAFAECTALEKVVIEAGITEIYNNAFSDCAKLLSVEIPYTVTYISDYVFSGCEKLTIKGYTGSEAENYANIYSIPFESLCEMPVYQVASGSCGSSSFWTLDSKGVMKITGSGTAESGYFSSYQSKITSVITEGIDEIAPRLFRYCYNLKELTLGEGLKTIGYSAFESCSSLKEVSFPKTMENVGGDAFSYCSGLERVTIPFELDNISYFCFYNAPMSMTVVGYEGSAAQELAEYGGFNFESLGIVEREVLDSGKCGDNLSWTVDNYGALIISGSGDMYDYTQETVPWKSYRVKTISLDSRITKIGAYAFYDKLLNEPCALPEELVEIGAYAFYNTGEIYKLTLPEGLKKIGSYAFGEVWMSAVFAAGDIEVIEENAFGEEPYQTFYGKAGSPLQEYAENAGATFLPLEAFGSCGDNLTYSVSVITGTLKISGSGDMHDYLDNEPPWGRYSRELKKITIENGVTSIGKFAFSNIWNVEAITIPGTIVNISEGAFNGSSLDKLVIEEGTKTIGAGVFRYCDIASVYLPESITSIDSSAFTYFYGTLYVYENSPAHSFALSNSLDFALRRKGALPELESVTAEKDGKNIYVTINGNSALFESDPIAALYDSENRLIELKLVTKEDIIFNNTGSYVKIMCWESLDSMTPVIDIEEAEVW